MATPEEERAFAAFQNAFDMGMTPQEPQTPAMTMQAPITAPIAPPQPPEPVDTFTPRFKSALQDDRFAALPQDEQVKFINLLYDNDERLKGLDPFDRENHLHETLSGFQKEIEHEQSGAGQFEKFAETPFGKFLMTPRGSEHLKDESGQAVANVVAGTPFLSTAALEFPRAALQVISDRFAGMETGAQAFKKQLDQGDYDPDQQRFFGNVAEWMNESIEKLPHSTREGFGEDVIGAVAGTAGYLTPMIMESMATGGSSIMPQMFLSFSGSQRQEVLDEAGVMENPEFVLASGAVQTASERLLGPGSMVGKNIFRKGVKDTMAKLAGRGAKRWALSASGEAVTEGFQNYVEQQVGEWSAGDKGWWDNLEKEDKKQVTDGMIFGGIVGGIAAVPTGLGSATMEARLGKIHNALLSIEGLSAEERGALGVFNLPALEALSTAPLTEDQLGELALEHAPEFLSTEQQTAFARGEVIEDAQFTPEQITELGEATKAFEAAQVRTDEAVEPVKARTETHKEAAVSIINKASEYADVLEERGEVEKAEEMRAAAQSFQFVAPKDNELAALGSLIDALGPKVQFYTAEGDLGVGGVARDRDTILVRWDSTKPQLVATRALHEAVHAVAKGDRKAESELYDILKEADPDLMKRIEDGEKALYAKREEEDLTPERLRSESLSRAFEIAGPSIFRVMRNRALNTNKDWAKDPGILGRMNEKMYTMLAKLSRKSPFVKQLIGEKDEALDPKNRRETAKLLGKLIGFLEGRKEEAAETRQEAEPDIVLGEKPTAVPEKIEKENLELN